MIYVETSVALAQLLAEDRCPPESLWRQSLASSRLTEYEVWTRVHARTLGSSHGESVRLLLGRFGWLEVTPTVLARALAARRPNAGCPSSRLNRVSPRPRSGRDAGNLRRSDDCRCASPLDSAVSAVARPKKDGHTPPESANEWGSCGTAVMRALLRIVSRIASAGPARLKEP